MCPGLPLSFPLFSVCPECFHRVSCPYTNLSVVSCLCPDPWLSREVHRSKKVKKKKEKTENNTSLESVLTSAGLKVKQFGMLSKSSTPVVSPSPPATDPLMTKLKSTFALSPSPGNFTETQRPASSLVPCSFRVEKEPALRVIQMKDELLEEIEELSEKLPSNTLDELIDQLGGPGKVSEVG